MSAPVPVLLAAGASRRLGEPKALAMLGGQSVLQRLLGAAELAGLGPTLVVGGAHASELRRALEDPRQFTDGDAWDFVEHPGWADGRSGSVARAARARPGRALLLLPADVPLVTADCLRVLVREHDRAGRPPGAWISPWVAVAGARRHGHPVLLGSALADRLLDWPAERPLRELRRLADPLLDVEVSDPAILDDLDTPEDLAALRARLGSSST